MGAGGSRMVLENFECEGKETRLRGLTVQLMEQLVFNLRGRGLNHFSAASARNAGADFAVNLAVFVPATFAKN